MKLKKIYSLALKNAKYTSVASYLYVILNCNANFLQQIT